MLFKGHFILSSFLSLQVSSPILMFSWWPWTMFHCKTKTKPEVIRWQPLWTAAFINPPGYICVHIVCSLSCSSVCYTWALNPNTSLWFQQCSPLPPATSIFIALLQYSVPPCTAEFLPSQHNLSWSYIPLQLLPHVCCFRVKFFERIFTFTVSDFSLHFPS